MQYICGTTDIVRSRESVVILGNFDGVHKGHQKLFEAAKKEAEKRKLDTVVLSFYPHPTWVVGTQKKPLIMSRKEKRQMIQHLGIDVLIEYPFTKAFAGISPEDFFVKILVQQLKVKCLVVGSNYFFGKDKAGNPEFLKQLGKDYAVKVCVIEAVKDGQDMISSTRIRQLIREGSVEKANHMLGHPYMITGEVMHGKKVGRTIGFPTINLDADPERVYLPNGVYATKVKVYSRTYLGMTNIGYNPTVSGNKKTIETNLLNFDQDIYGQEVEVDFYHFIRPEVRFENINRLKEQITTDQKATELFFQRQTTDNCKKI